MSQKNTQFDRLKLAVAASKSHEFSFFKRPGEAGKGRSCLLNGRIALQIVIMAVLAILFIYMVATGNYKKYIHPRYLPFLWLSIFILLGGIVAQAARINEVNLRFRLNGFLWVLIPLFAAFFAYTPAPTESIGLERYDEQVAGSGNQSTLNLTGAQGATGTGSGAAGMNGTGDGAGLTDQAGTDQAEVLPKIKGSINIDSAHYASWLVEMMTNTDKYVGKTYTYLGRISQEPELPADKFLPGRPIMFCCAADAKNMGLLADMQPKIKAKLGQWVYVTAKIVKRKGGDPLNPSEEAAMLKIIDLTDAPTPVNIYAYYYGTVKVPTEVNK